MEQGRVDAALLEAICLLHDLYYPPGTRVDEDDLVIHIRVSIGDVPIFSRDFVIFDTFCRQYGTYRNWLIVREHPRMLLDHVFLETRPFLDAEQSVDPAGDGANGASDDTADRACSIVALFGPILRPRQHSLG